MNLKSMNLKSKIWVFWIVLFIVSTMVWSVVRQQPSHTNATTYSRFLQQILSRAVEAVGKAVTGF